MGFGQTKKYDSIRLEDAALTLIETGWKDETAAEVFFIETKAMLKKHCGQHHILLQPDIIDDIHGDWVYKIISRKHLEKYKPSKNRTVYSYLYSGMRLHLLSCCLAVGRKYHWAQPEIPISQLERDGEPMQWEDIEPSAHAVIWGSSDEN